VLAEMYIVKGNKEAKTSLEKIKKSKVKISKRRDLKAEPLSWAEVKMLSKLSGGADKLFDEEGFKKDPSLKNGSVLSENQMLKLMAKDHNFIKTPILLLENREVVYKFDDRSLKKINK